MKSVSSLLKPGGVRSAASVWLVAMLTMVGQANVSGVTCLSNVADDKAKLLEVAAQRKARQAWRQWLSDGRLRRRGLGKASSKNTYRWVRGLAGWTQSPVGMEELNDDFPAAESVGIAGGVL